MKFKTLMIIKAVVCLALGIPLLLMPHFLYSLFGAALEQAGEFAAREYGAALMGSLMITWFARNIPASDARWAISLGYCVYDLIGFVISVVATLTGILNPLGWFVVSIYMFFTLGFGYFTVKDYQPALHAQPT